MKIEYKKPTEKELRSALEIINEADRLYYDISKGKGLGGMDDDPWTFEELKRNKKRKKYRVLIVDGIIVGFTSWKIRFGGLAWISHFVIKNDFRRKGLGKIFIEEIEKEAKSLSAYLALEYWPDAPWAEKFYLKNGFFEDEKVFKSKSTYTKVLVKKI